MRLKRLSICRDLMGVNKMATIEELLKPVEMSQADAKFLFSMLKMAIDWGFFKSGDVIHDMVKLMNETEKQIKF